MTLVPPGRLTRDVPADVRALSSLPAADYADRCTVATEVVAPPEQWARVMFGNVPTAAEQLIWRGLLNLRLSPGRSPDTVGGWRIGARGDDWIRLEAASWHLSANMLVQTGSGSVSWTTLVRFDRLPGRAVWLPASAVHRRLVPPVLRGAAARLGSDRRVPGGVTRGRRGS